MTSRLIFPRFHGHRVKPPPSLRTERGSDSRGLNDDGLIIEHFDPFKNILSGLFPSDVAPMIHELGFQGMKEAFDHGRRWPPA
jgi:hypothetical protein